MTYKQVIRIIHKFIPRFIREQFINDAVAQYSEIKRLNREAILSAEKTITEEVDKKEVDKKEVDKKEVDKKEFVLVSSIEELGCGYELLFKSIDRTCKMSGATLVIDSKEYKKDDINTVLPDVFVYMLSNVSVVGRTNLIINSNKFYSFDLNEMHSYHEIKRPDIIKKVDTDIFAIDFKKSDNNNLLPDKVFVHLLDDYSFNYYHFMVEVLPRFIKILDVLKQQSDYNLNDYVFLVDKRVSEQNISALRAIAGNDVNVCMVTENQEFFCHKLVYCKPVSVLLENHSNPPNIQKDIVIDEEALLEVRNRIFNAIDIKLFKTFNTRKVYLQRISDFRKITNINELELLMHKRGFEFVNTAGLSLEEQISLFQHAEYVVGPSGASFTNIIFMRPGTNVINLCPSVSTVNYNVFQALASSVDVNLVYFLTKPIDNTVFLHSPSAVDLNAFEKYLDQLGI
ncbi:glycosyltransferase family 61 protein [Francisella philomiragia]|uniref:glycosyltransferase family 61 protein n=1 Tax=Francisella philomiragia TaxID=28110 RepID=UPI0035184859